MNTPNRNTVVNMTMDWVDWTGSDIELHDDWRNLGDVYFNGETAISDSYWSFFIGDDNVEFWDNMKDFKEQVWDKHVSAQFDFMQLWHDELNTKLYTIDWLFGITNEHHIPFEVPIIAGFMRQETDAFGQRLLVVQENEASLIAVQALARGRNARWRTPCFGFGD